MDRLTAAETDRNGDGIWIVWQRQIPAGTGTGNGSSGSQGNVEGQNRF